MTVEKSVLWVMLGGALGAAARYLLGGWAQRRFGATFPWGTLLINLSGSFVLGFFTGLRIGGRWMIPAFLTPTFAIGFVGAYTTFSTFAVETVTLIEQGSPLLAFGNILASVVAGLTFAAIGLMIGRSV
jgi:CrcB protein